MLKVVFFGAKMNEITADAFLGTLRATVRAGNVPYYLFYSSLWDGYVTDPALMLIPFHDHLTHRGDGVFETLKCVDGAVYNLDAHLQRLQRSAYLIGIAHRRGPEALREKVLEALEVAKQPNCSVRVLLSRGPGGMGVAPSESQGTALYILVYGGGEPFMRKHPQGATLRKSRVPIKPPVFATAKTCNYIPNVMMRAEAEVWHVDFMVGVDAHGHITEGATENIGIVSKNGRLLFPPLDTILAGTTMLRVSELAQQLEADGSLKGVVFRPIREEELYEAREILAIGTTLNVASVVEYNGRRVGDGKPGEIGRKLDALIERDTHENDALRVRYM